MSKKKSNTKASDTLDETLIGKKKKDVVADDLTKEVSLVEFSKNGPFSFNEKHYKILLIGLAVNILGFILMMGGATDDPAKFDGDALFSATRITIAPMLIVLGYAVIAYAIMKRPKPDQE